MYNNYVVQLLAFQNINFIITISTLSNDMFSTLQLQGKIVMFIQLKLIIL